jgi:hypothetical protein
LRKAVTKTAKPGAREGAAKDGSIRIEAVSRILQHYADRAVFRGFSPGVVKKGKAAFKILWHRDRQFDLIVDTRSRTMSFPLLLPDFEASMIRELNAFLVSRQSKNLPEHRRIDTKKAVVRSTTRGGNVGLTLALKGDHYEYGIQKLIHLVHEIFLTFLSEGRYYEYQVETFELDPDHP